MVPGVILMITRRSKRGLNTGVASSRKPLVHRFLAKDGRYCWFGDYPTAVGCKQSLSCSKGLIRACLHQWNGIAMPWNRLTG